MGEIVIVKSIGGNLEDDVDGFLVVPFDHEEIDKIDEVFLADLRGVATVLVGDVGQVSLLAGVVDIALPDLFEEEIIVPTKSKVAVVEEEVAQF